jgi:hypothetical protein
VPVLAIAATEGEGEMKLYTYYRSQASFRVRIALNLKGIAREDSFLHLEKGAYRAINPQMVVPTLIDGDIKLFQSLVFSNISTRRIRSRRYCRLTHWQGLGAWARIDQRADSHPLIVPRVRHYLTDVLKRRRVMQTFRPSRSANLRWAAWMH